jgi:hypothetical protein
MGSIFGAVPERERRGGVEGGGGEGGGAWEKVIIKQCLVSKTFYTFLF